MRRPIPLMAPLMAVAAALIVTGCNTVRGAGEDARSIGRVFSHHPDGPPRRR